ncbi:MAG: epoxyqueuosine reductase QueH [Oligosphaeraceae bacterium]
MPSTRTSPSILETPPGEEAADTPLLLHCCCGPCATACLERLAAQGRPCALFFSNSNLDSREEFQRRLDALETVAAHFGVREILVDPYRHDLWSRFVGRLCPGFAAQPEGGERCRQCFRWSLSRTAAAAARKGWRFATSLTVSPHKNSRLLLSLGATFPHFQPYDFKKKDGFLRSTILSRQLGLYRQNYCGCPFSRREPEPR